MNLFTDHPRSNGMTYCQHLVYAWGLCFRLCRGSLCCFIHGLFPFLFAKAATSVKEDLIDSLSTMHSNAKRDIKLLILDVDGTLTDGTVFYPDRTTSFTPRDGHGMRLLIEKGVDIAIVTGRPKSTAVELRCNDLQVKYQVFNSQDKRQAIYDLVEKTGIPCANMAYMGDDAPDVPAMQIVGLSFAPADAHHTALAAAQIVTEDYAGMGAVREATDIICQFLDS